MASEEKKAYYELTQSAVWPYLKGHLEKRMSRDVKYAISQEDVMQNNKSIAQAELAKSLLIFITSNAADYLKVQKPFVTMPPASIMEE